MGKSGEQPGDLASAGDTASDKARDAAGAVTAPLDDEISGVISLPIGPPFSPVRLGNYELLRRIAAGGMAEIFLARTRGSLGLDGAGPTDGAAAASSGARGLGAFEKFVVIKRMLPALAVQPDFVAMFVDEAKLAAAMQHPNIVQTFDVGQEDGSYFMALEYLHGEDLRTMFRALRAEKRRMPLDQVAHVISHVCAGLQYAHDRLDSDGNPLHVVHRDVSPQNVLVSYDGAVKLLDFGIAKAEGRFGETKYGTLKGKIGYMSPEQCRGEPLDRRSDVFTAAILLFELSTGRRLYRGASEYEVLRRIVEGEVPSPRLLVAANGDGTDYPEELDRIVMKGLAKDPAARYQSARELAEELESFARHERLATSPLALARFMEQLFGRKLEAWREALREGRDVLEQLAQQGGELAREALHDEALHDEDLLVLPAAEASTDGSSGSVPVRVSDTPSARPKSASTPHRVPTPPPTPPSLPAASRLPGKPRRATETLPTVSLPSETAASQSGDAGVRKTPRSTPAASAIPAAPPASSASPASPRLSSLVLVAASFLVVGATAGIMVARDRGDAPSGAAPQAASRVDPAQQAGGAAAPTVAAEGTAVIEVTTDPAGASVSLDGRAPIRAGDAARFEIAGAAGSHLIVAEAQGCFPSVEHVTVRAGERRAIHLVLTPTSAAPRR